MAKSAYEKLVADYLSGSQTKFTFFWVHTSSDDRLGKECLSQWFPAPFEASGDVYLTAEHWMMAEKARLFDDEASRQRILEAPTPADAKRLGREVLGFDNAKWVSARVGVVTQGSLLKFTQHAPLRDYLLSTGDSVLVEASPHDRVWGIGLSSDDDRASDPTQWPGLNLLGFILMDVRASFQSVQPTPP